MITDLLQIVHGSITRQGHRYSSSRSISVCSVGVDSGDVGVCGGSTGVCGASVGVYKYLLTYLFLCNLLSPVFSFYCRKFKPRCFYWLHL